VQDKSCLRGWSRITDWKELVGKRVLLKILDWWYEIVDAKVIEVSPSTQYVELEIRDKRDPFKARREWYSADRLEVLEVLDDV